MFVCIPGDSMKWLQFIRDKDRETDRYRTSMFSLITQSNVLLCSVIRSDQKVSPLWYYTSQ
jgi:hypothetical protein